MRHIYSTQINDRNGKAWNFEAVIEQEFVEGGQHPSGAVEMIEHIYVRDCRYSTISEKWNMKLTSKSTADSPDIFTQHEVNRVEGLIKAWFDLRAKVLESLTEDDAYDPQGDFSDPYDEVAKENFMASWKRFQ